MGTGVGHVWPPPAFASPHPPHTSCSSKHDTINCTNNLHSLTLCGRASREFHSTFHPTKMVTTALKLIILSSGVADALLASYDIKQVPYYS